MTEQAGQPAGVKGSYLPAVIDVLTLAGEKISAVTAFLAADAAGVPQDGGQESGEEYFARFGLPAELTWRTRRGSSPAPR